MRIEYLFDNRHIDVFSPYDGVEYIYSILQNTGHHDFTTRKAREHGLAVIGGLFDLELIEVFSWGDYQKLFYNLNLDRNQIVKLIDNIWFIGADYSDFIGMPMFKHKDWYIKALEKLGMTHTTDWKTFVEKKIGNLEKWIEENRPKD